MANLCNSAKDQQQPLQMTLHPNSRLHGVTQILWQLKPDCEAATIADKTCHSPMNPLDQQSPTTVKAANSNHGRGKTNPGCNLPGTAH